MQILRSKKFKLAGVGLIAAAAIVGLIRCVPSDQAVVSDDTVSEKVKEAEAAEEAEAQAMRLAHGEDEAKSASESHGKSDTHKADSKANQKHDSKHADAHAEKPAKTAEKIKEAKAEHKAEEKDAHTAEHKTEAAHSAPKHEAKTETKPESKKEAAPHAPKTASWGRPAGETKHTEPAHVERAPASTPASGSVYVVQVGAFRVKENAENLLAKLKEAGFPVRMQTMNHSKNGELHVVRFEPTLNKAEAEESVAQLKSKESMAAAILKIKADQ